MKVVFWAVDCQKDFITRQGALYVKGAEEIRLNLRILTEVAQRNNVTIVNTGDYHNDLSEELSDDPDFNTTFPRHCVMGTVGSEFIDEVMPRLVDKTFYVGPNYAKLVNESSIVGAKNIVIYKDKVDVFEGNTYAKDILNFLHPDTVIVYGVTTQLCVNAAVRGIIDGKRQVLVVADAIKELPDMPIVDVIHDWKSKGVKLIPTDSVEELLKSGE